MFCLSGLLSYIYPSDTANLTAALDTHNIPYRFLPNLSLIHI